MHICLRDPAHRSPRLLTRESFSAEHLMSASQPLLNRHTTQNLSMGAYEGIAGWNQRAPL